MHRLTPAELEKQLKKMKNTQVISICMDMASQLRLLEKQSSTKLEKINEEDELSISEDLFDSISSLGRTRCRFSVSGCPFRLPSMEEHELRECKFRPARCPSLTCPVRPPFAKLLRHIDVSFILNCTEKPFSPKRNFLGFLSKQKKFQKKNQVSKLRKDIRVTQIFQTILYVAFEKKKSKQTKKFYYLLFINCTFIRKSCQLGLKKSGHPKGYQQPLSNFPS